MSNYAWGQPSTSGSPGTPKSGRVLVDQTDLYFSGAPIPRVYGTAWVKPILGAMWTHFDTTTGLAAFPSINGDTLVYGPHTADCVLILCDHAATFAGVRRGTETFTGSSGDPLHALRRMMGTTLTSIGPPNVRSPAPYQVINALSSPWGFTSTSTEDSYTNLTGAFPEWAYLAAGAPQNVAINQGWQGTTHIRAQNFALDENNLIPAGIKFQVTGIGGDNANPADVIQDLMVNVMGIPSDQVETDHGADGTTASSYRNYVTSFQSGTAWYGFNFSFRINRALTTRESPDTLLSDLLLATNSEMVYESGVFRIQPLQDAAVGTFTPPTTGIAITQLTGIIGEIEDDIRQDSEVYNSFPITFPDSSKTDGSTSTLTYPDDIDASSRGLRTASTTSNNWITHSSHAKVISHLLAKRSIYARHTYRFKLTSRWVVVEKGDVISISDGLGIPSPVSVRISRLSHNEDSTIDCEGWNWGGNTTPIDLIPHDSAASGTLIPSIRPASTAATGIGYTEDSSGNPTSGVKIDRLNNIIKVAPGSVQVGDYLLGSALRCVAAGAINVTSGTFTVNPTFSKNIGSLSRVDYGSGSPRYALRVNWTNEAAASANMVNVCIPSWVTSGYTTMYPMWIGLLIAAYSDFSFITSGGSYNDPNSVDTGFVVLRFALF